MLSQSPSESLSTEVHCGNVCFKFCFRPVSEILRSKKINIIVTIRNITNNSAEKALRGRCQALHSLRATLLRYKIYAALFSFLNNGMILSRFYRFYS